MIKFAPLLIFLAFASGAVLPFQAGINARLGRSLHDSGYSALISFIIGTIGLIFYTVVTRVNYQAVLDTAHEPWWVWIGGLLGAFYVVVVIVVIPHLGGALTFGLIVAGQLIFSLIVDHFGLLGTPVHPVNTLRIIGVLLIIAGVLLIRLF